MTDSAPAILSQKKNWDLFEFQNKTLMFPLLFYTTCMVHIDGICGQFSGADSMKSIMDRGLNVIVYRPNAMKNHPFVKLLNKQKTI